MFDATRAAWYTCRMNTKPAAGAVTVNFTKFFTAGPLAGVCLTDEITFPDRDAAARWIAAVRRPRANRGYVITPF